MGRIWKAISGFDNNFGEDPQDEYDYDDEYDDDYDDEYDDEDDEENYEEARRGGVDEDGQAIDDNPTGFGEDDYQNDIDPSFDDEGGGKKKSGKLDELKKLEDLKNLGGASKLAMVAKAVKQVAKRAKRSQEIKRYKKIARKLGVCKTKIVLECPICHHYSLMQSKLLLDKFAPSILFLSKFSGSKFSRWYCLHKTCDGSYFKNRCFQLMDSAVEMGQIPKKTKTKIF